MIQFGVILLTCWVKKKVQNIFCFKNEKFHGMDSGVGSVIGRGEGAGVFLGPDCGWASGYR